MGLTYTGPDGEERPVRCQWCWSQQAVVRTDVSGRPNVPVCNPCKAQMLKLAGKPRVPLEVRRVG